MFDASLVPIWRQNHYNATLVSLKKVHSELSILRIKPDAGVPAHKAGQYVTLGMGLWEPRCDAWNDVTDGNYEKVLKRSYSITHPILSGAGGLSEPQDGVLDFYIVVVKSDKQPPAPSLTPRLFLLKEGDRLNIGTKITGHYNLDHVQSDDDVLFLSTGTGEAPHLYMIWQLLRNKHRGKIVTMNCVRYRKDLAYLNDLEQLKVIFPQVIPIHLTTREETGSKKYIQDLLRLKEWELETGFSLRPGKCHVYLCGNPAMIGVPSYDENGIIQFTQPDGAIELLVQRGLVPDNPRKKITGQIHFEEYW